ETSETQTQAVPGIDAPAARASPTGLAHLRLYGVRYYVAYDACKNQDETWAPCADLKQQDTEIQAAKAAGLPEVATSGRFHVYQIGTGNLVEVPKFRPVLVDHHDWRATGLSWYGHPDWLETPLAFASSGDKAARAAFAQSGPLPLTHPPPGAPARPGGLAATTSPTRHQPPFRTDRIGEPHIVKVSWFPNWRVEGAEGPWLLSPGLMVVVRTQAWCALSSRGTP